ncbi:MAG: CHC2 zinc finger domain-containing protein [Sphingomicrobium sp.]
MICFDAIRRQHLLADVAGRHIALKRIGNEWTGLCPFHEDGRPSFTIFADGQRFYCFGCSASGDVLDFVAVIEGIGLVEAASRLSVDYNKPAFLGPSRACQCAQQRPSPEELGKMERVRSIWNSAQPAPDTLAAVYLASRAITGPIPASIRFAVLAAGRGVTGPALVASIVSLSGGLIGVQRTFLAADGSGKATMDKPKLSLGSVRGGAIRCGEPAEILIIAEGLEDALSAQMIFGLPAWASAGAGMMGKMALPDRVRSVIIAVDNDAAGERAADTAASAYRLQGRDVSLVRPSGRYKDFNDELRGADAR